MTSTPSDSASLLIMNRFHAAQSKHTAWHGLWQECYDYALPQRATIGGVFSPAHRRSERLYDATALDSVDQLASLLLGNLTPPLTPWFGLKAGTDLSEDEARKIAPVLEKTARLIQHHFDQSNFIVEIHQNTLHWCIVPRSSITTPM